MRILVIEDDSKIASFIERGLREDEQTIPEERRLVTAGEAAWACARS